MKKLIYGFIINYSILIINCPAQWEVVSTTGNEAFSFPDATTGYSTNNGLTYKTTNGGVNWAFITSGNLTGIWFINDQTGWIVGWPGLIKQTTNGGTSFT